MSAEAPIQIDLSQDNSWDQIDDSMLSDDEKRLLAEQFREDTEGIISLTQEELRDFKQIISSETPEIVASELQEFVEEQKNEGLSTSDLIWDSIELWEIDLLDQYSKEALFWDEWIFKNYSISDTAQDIMSVSLTLSILQYGADMEANQIPETSNTREWFDFIVERLGVLKSAWEQMQAWPWWISTQVPAINIDNFWEWNSIFMNPTEWKDFFHQILEWDLNSPESIIEKIESANTWWEIPLEISGLWEIVLEDISWLVETEWWSIEISDTDRDILDNPETTPEERQSLLERWENSDNFFLQILAALFSLGKWWDTQTQWDTTTTWREGTEHETSPEEIAPTLHEQGRSIFREKLSEWSITSFDVWELLKLFPEDGELSARAKQIVNHIDSIPDFEWQTDFESKFNNLFLTETSTWDKKIDSFVDAWDARTIEEGKEVWENLANTLVAYISYRTTGNRVPYEEWFQTIDWED